MALRRCLWQAVLVAVLGLLGDRTGSERRALEEEDGTMRFGGWREAGGRCEALGPGLSARWSVFVQGCVRVLGCKCL